MSKENLMLWNSVEKTDPAFTKDFNRGGGFKGTAINPTYLAKKATEAFGPAGLGWGWKVLCEEQMVGAPIADDCREIIHSLHVEVWYRPTREMCERYGVEFGYIARISQYGATTFVGKNKYGPFTDEETKKKSLTDGVGKCLALIGFSSDVHMGRYDDSKYVNDRRAEVAAAAKVQFAVDESKVSILLSQCKTKEDIGTAWKQLGVAKEHPQYGAVLALFQAAKAKIETPPVAEKLAE